MLAAGTVADHVAPDPWVMASDANAPLPMAQRRVAVATSSSSLMAALMASALPASMVVTGVCTIVGAVASTSFTAKLYGDDAPATGAVDWLAAAALSTATR